MSLNCRPDCRHSVIESQYVTQEIFDFSFKYAANPAIYAQAPDESVHHLTNAEWQAAGAPTPQIR